MINSSDQSNADSMKIDASPTKQLFIEMLVKDITLKDAIGDLIDNSVDAAKKAVPTDATLEGFTISIEAHSEKFIIFDNCGGLEADVARSSAFCFGKPKGYIQGKYTIGQFGIGMKRAFFKIGSYINVESVALISSFKMHIDVTKWSNEKLWDFKFDELNDKQNNEPTKTHTKIEISGLIDDAKDKFEDNQFINELISEIALEHLYTINRGLIIEINGIRLKAKQITVTYDTQVGIEPVYWKHTFRNGLEAEIMAGVSEDKGAEGGWYIFCNERLILGPDTTEITGWSGSGSKEMPKYHDQFFRFRGYVFFKADNSAKLPWNTTKTGMDSDSPPFILVRNQMIIIAKQVKKLMDDMKKERERGNPEAKRILSRAIEKANVVAVNQVMAEKNHLPKVYRYPEQLLNVAPKTKKQGVKITFYKSDSAVEDVKKYFKVDDADSAGSLAFDNFYENEIG